MLSDAISQYAGSGQWPVAATLAVVLFGIAILVLAIFMRVYDLRTGTVGSRPVQLSRGQRIFRVVGGAVFALILVILYAPFLIMGVLSFAERTTAVFPPSDFSFISYQKLFNPNDFSLYRIPGEPLVNYLTPDRSLGDAGAPDLGPRHHLRDDGGARFRERFPGRGAVFYALLLGMVTPGIILGLGFRLFADQISLPTGWRTTGLLTHIAWTMPFGFIVFLVFLNRFDRTIEEAAAVLGASAWTTFRTVTLPVLAPGVLASTPVWVHPLLRRNPALIARPGTGPDLAHRHHRRDNGPHHAGALRARLVDRAGFVRTGRVLSPLLRARTPPLLRHACHRGRGGDGHGYGSRSRQRGGRLERELSHLGRHRRHVHRCGGGGRRWQAEHQQGADDAPPRVRGDQHRARGCRRSTLGLSVRDLLAASESFTYGTTRATNAIVEGKTARTAFFTTHGFPGHPAVAGRRQTGPLPATPVSAALRPALPDLRDRGADRLRRGCLHPPR